MQVLQSLVFHDTLVGKLEDTEVAAFNEGLFVKISDSIPDASAVRSISSQFNNHLTCIIQAFRMSSGMFLMKQLYCRRITEPKQVLERVVFPHIADNACLPIVHAGTPELEENVPYDGLCLRLLAERFKKHLQRYLHGRGHPDLPVYNTLINQELREEARNDPSFRARQFASLMSGSIFLALPARDMEVCWL